MRVLERLRAWRELRWCTPLVPGAPEGSRVQVAGVVRVLDETVIAPLTGRECVLARSRIRGTGLFMQPRMLQIKPFLLEPSRVQSLVVDGEAAVLGVPPQKVSNIERETAFAARFAVKPPGTAWYEEIVVAAGDRITVGGVLMRDLNPQPPTHERAFRERLAPRLRLVGSTEHPLVIVAHR